MLSRFAPPFKDDVHSHAFPTMSHRPLTLFPDGLEQTRHEESLLQPALPLASPGSITALSQLTGEFPHGKDRVPPFPQHEKQSSCNDRHQRDEEGWIEESDHDDLLSGVVRPR